jgi:uncharacterized protein YndB with AHSA1/START domain
MATFEFTKPPVAKAEMLVRKPVHEVFEAIADPAITSQFWFSRGSGPLEPGARVEWEWEMYGFTVPATVRAFEQDRRIVVDWGEGDQLTTIEWRFTPVPDGTFVSVTNDGFSGDGDTMIEQAIGSTEGFTFVLAGLKAWLEHEVRLNLVPDRFPAGLEEVTA